MKEQIKHQIKHYEERLNYQWDAADLAEQLDKGANVVIIDTRKRPAFELEHIANAIHLPHRDMTLETTSSLDKKVIYICYCDGIGCNGSTKGALKMAKLGFDVRELIGGLKWWKEEGYATAGNHASVSTTTQCAC